MHREAPENTGQIRDYWSECGSDPNAAVRLLATSAEELSASVASTLRLDCEVSVTPDRPDPAGHIGGGTLGVRDQQDQQYKDTDNDTVSVVST